MDNLYIKEIKEALEYGENNGRTCDTLLAAARDGARWKCARKHKFYENMIAELTETGDTLLGTPICVTPFSTYRIYEELGSRQEFSHFQFAKRKRLNVFALLSLLFGEDRYLRELEDIIWAICDEYTWVVVAQMGESLSVIPRHDPLDERGRVRSRQRVHQERLELFSSETAFALSEICSLLEDKLSPLVVSRARKLVYERVVRPFMDINEMFWWETCEMNWAAVCAGSAGIAAMYTVVDSAVLAPILARALSVMRSYIEGFAPDGACTESLGYWNYGFGFYLCFADLLKERTAGRIDLMQGEHIHQIALFQQKCYLSGNHVASFSDSGKTFCYRIGMLHRLKQLFPDVEIPDFQYHSGLNGDNCYRWGPALRDYVWSDPALETGVGQNATWYCPDAKWFVSRHQADGCAVAFAAKGGHNDEPHNHNDIGSFLYHIDGISFLDDLGGGEYTRDYFTDGRYTYFCNRSEGHSLPIINGQGQQAGRSYAGEVLRVETNGTDAFELELAGAYGLPGLDSLRRAFVFQKDAPFALTLTDTYQFTQRPQRIVERFICKAFAEVDLSKPGRAVIAYEGQMVYLDYDPQKWQPTVWQEAFSNHAAQREDIPVIDFMSQDPGDTLCFQMVIHP